MDKDGSFSVHLSALMVMDQKEEDVGHSVVHHTKDVVATVPCKIMSSLKYLSYKVTFGVLKLIIILLFHELSV